MAFDGKTILVAGGTGLAGAGVVRQVLAVGGNPTIRVPHRGDGGLRYDDPRIEYVRADLTDRADCLRVAEGCDMAVMAAAFTAGAHSALAEPWLQVTDNVVMDMRMLEAFHARGVRRVVYVSTATVYQDREGFLREDDLLLDEDPPGAYFGVAWAKRYLEKACRFWHDKTGMEILIARLSNVFGPGAKFDPKTSHFIAGLVRKACDRMDPFEVWGSPHVVRDVLYADDFGRAVVAMLSASPIAFDIFNIGSGRKTTVGEVVEWALSQSGHRPSEVRYQQAGPSTVPFRGLDCAKANSLLGWHPEIGVEDGVRRTVEWWREHAETWSR